MFNFIWKESAATVCRPTSTMSQERNKYAHSSVGSLQSRKKRGEGSAGKIKRNIDQNNFQRLRTACKRIISIKTKGNLFLGQILDRIFIYLSGYKQGLNIINIINNNRSMCIFSCMNK